MGNNTNSGALSIVVLLFACACGDADDSSTGDTVSDTNEDSSSTDATTDPGETDGGGMCGGSPTTADCATYCTGVLAAACPGGPGSQEECEQGCEMLNGAIDQCPAWGTLVECSQTAPQFTCFMGETVPEGCEEEFYCLSQCFGGGG